MREYPRIPTEYRYSPRVHTEYGGLQNTTQEYRAEPRRIRKRIPYSSSYSEYGKEYGIVHAEYAQNTRKSSFDAFALLCRLFLDHDGRARPCVNWVAIPIHGLGHNRTAELGLFCLLAFCHLSFCLAQLLVDCFRGDARPLTSSFFHCGRLGSCLLLLLQAVGGSSERKKATHERQGGQHAL